MTVSVRESDLARHLRNMLYERGVHVARCDPTAAESFPTSHHAGVKFIPGYSPPLEVVSEVKRYWEDAIAYTDLVDHDLRKNMFLTLVPRGLVVDSDRWANLPDFDALRNFQMYFHATGLSYHRWPSVAAELICGKLGDQLKKWARKDDAKAITWIGLIQQISYGLPVSGITFESWFKGFCRTMAESLKHPPMPVPDICKLLEELPWRYHRGFLDASSCAMYAGIIMENARKNM